MTIVSFKDEAAEDIALGHLTKQSMKTLPVNLHGIAQIKLAQIDNAISLLDLLNLQGNKLEKLLGNRSGQYSIRINKKYRICFYWQQGNAYSVEIVDYHK